jgi:hypothetical protein
MDTLTLDRRTMMFAALKPLVVPVAAQAAEAFYGRWTAERARRWERETGRLVGTNYAPAYAVNQLEMWQADTFDVAAIDRELAWAAELGFNSFRVFLHDLLWKQDSDGFCRRIDQYLHIADRRGIGTMFVLFDSVWDPYPRLGSQRAPTPGLHNSGWVQSPGIDVLREPLRHEELKGYVQGLLSRYGGDRRVHAWDLMNEPDNPNASSYTAWEPANKAELSLSLLRKTFAWAREMDPIQPLTTGVWCGDWSDHDKMTPLHRFQVEASDVVSYHCYEPLSVHREQVEMLRRYDRPLLCTEYMARGMGSTFESILPYLLQQGIGAYNWGFVKGKSQTHMPWDSWKEAYIAEPPLWFHDILHEDGRPYLAGEVAFLKHALAS